jgi:ABC-type multidrug transport system fused ATPase/permease subunit
VRALSAPASAAPGVAPPGLAVELRDVRFAYDDGREVLRGISLRIAPGESIGIVGARCARVSARSIRRSNASLHSLP